MLHSVRHGKCRFGECHYADSRGAIGARGTRLPPFSVKGLIFTRIKHTSLQCQSFNNIISKCSNDRLRLPGALFHFLLLTNALPALLAITILGACNAPRAITVKPFTVVINYREPEYFVTPTLV